MHNKIDKTSAHTHSWFYQLRRILLKSPHPECSAPGVWAGAHPGAGLVTTVPADLPHADLRHEAILYPRRPFMWAVCELFCLGISWEQSNRKRGTNLREYMSNDMKTWYRSGDCALSQLRVSPPEPGHSAGAAALPLLRISDSNKYWKLFFTFLQNYTWCLPAECRPLPGTCTIGSKLTMSLEHVQG